MCHPKDMSFSFVYDRDEITSDEKDKQKKATLPQTQYFICVITGNYSINSHIKSTSGTSSLPFPSIRLLVVIFQRL